MTNLKKNKGIAAQLVTIERCALYSPIIGVAVISVGKGHTNAKSPIVVYQPIETALRILATAVLK